MMFLTLTLLLGLAVATNGQYLPVLPADLYTDDHNATAHSPLCARSVVWSALDIPTDLEWFQYICEGAKQAMACMQTDEAAAILYGKEPGALMESPWRAPPETMMWNVANAGWREFDPRSGNLCEFSNRGLYKSVLLDALRFLRLNIHSSTKVGGLNKGYRIRHGHTTNTEPRVYDQIYKDAGAGNIPKHKTGAFYNFGVNRVEGVIFIFDASNPEHSATRLHEQGEWPDDPKNKDNMPSIHRASDIIAAHWLHEHKHPTNLQYVFFVDVRDPVTVKICSRFMLRTPSLEPFDKPPLWPGLILNLNLGSHWENEAIIGSPLGTLMTHLLIQYKADLGVKRPSHVHIFRGKDKHTTESELTLNILFILEDIPNPVADQPPEDIPLVDPPGPQIQPFIVPDQPQQGSSQQMQEQGFRGPNRVFRVHTL